MKDGCVMQAYIFEHKCRRMKAGVSAVRARKENVAYYIKNF